MLQIANLTELNKEDIPKLLDKIKPILEKRKKLHEKYSRNANQSTLLYSNDNKTTKITFEKYITDLATGYLSGTPIYSVSDTVDEDKKKLLSSLLEKVQTNEDYKKGMEIIIDYIKSYNDDHTENHDLIHDILELTGCYEILYENSNNEIVYSKYSPLQTVATWDYNIPANLTGIVRVWEETDINDSIYTMVELTDIKGTRSYKLTNEYKEVTELDNTNHNWGDVPAIAIETDYAIFEPCEDIINAYEQLIQNIRNTFQYNDTDCKLKVSGYAPENPMTIIDDNGNVAINPARQIEDNMLIKTLTFYIGEKGDVGWISKPLDSVGVQNILKIYIDLMFQLAGIPNTSDLAFNSADLNASAIDRKFYVMNMATAGIISKLKQAYLRRWELIFNRINLKKGTNFDFRDIDIEIPKNLPANNDEQIDSMLKLQNILSEQTIVEKLGYNYLDEQNKKDTESDSNMLKNIKRIKTVNNTYKGNATTNKQPDIKEINNEQVVEK